MVEYSRAWFSFRTQIVPSIIISISEAPIWFVDKRSREDLLLYDGSSRLYDGVSRSDGSSVCDIGSSDGSRYI